jgi:hypothetical protein
MKEFVSIWILLFATTIAPGQVPDTSRIEFAKEIKFGSPLLIQYDHGGCFISHSQQIIVEDANPDSLVITIKRLLPVAYRHYRYNEKKRKHEAQDSIQITNPFAFTYPTMGDKDYCTSKSEYLPELTFNVSRLKLTNFINEFVYLADKKELQLSGTETTGLYSDIHLTHENVTKHYTFQGWYQLDLKFQQLQ